MLLSYRDTMTPFSSRKWDFSDIRCAFSEFEAPYQGFLESKLNQPSLNEEWVAGELCIKAITSMRRGAMLTRLGLTALTLLLGVSSDLVLDSSVDRPLEVEMNDLLSLAFPAMIAGQLGDNIYNVIRSADQAQLERLKLGFSSNPNSFLYHVRNYGEAKQRILIALEDTITGRLSARIGVQFKNGYIGFLEPLCNSKNKEFLQPVKHKIENYDQLLCMTDNGFHSQGVIKKQIGEALTDGGKKLHIENWKDASDRNLYAVSGLAKPHASIY
jgi:hypothetical protein